MIGKSMAICNRCGENFDNLFNGLHWCTNCGKQFAFDINEEETKK